MLLALLALLPASGFCAAERFFQPEPGFVRAQDLPEDFRARVDTIRFEIKDAFEGSAAYSGVERWSFDLLNRIHVDSRPATLANRLLFRRGDEVGKGILLETEKALRTEEFLSDAVIEAGPDRQGARTIKVTSYDQWTTVALAGVPIQRLTWSDVRQGRFGKLFDEWFLGAFEANFLGSGTRLGGFFRHDELRNTSELRAQNLSVTPARLQASAYGAVMTDGHGVHLRVARPLRSREERHGFLAYMASRKSAELHFFDANRLDLLPDSLARNRSGGNRVLRTYAGYVIDSLNLAYTRSFGSTVKLDAGPFFDRYDRYWRGGAEEGDSALLAHVAVPASAEGPEIRTDALLGVEVEAHRFFPGTARNYRNLKWNETVEKGWRVGARAAMNQPWLGAGDSDFHLGHEALFAGGGGPFLAACSASAQYFLGREGWRNGAFAAAGDVLWRPHPLTATYLSASWDHFFAAPKSRQLILGAREGLSGYPISYFAGQARCLAAAEQRLFPEWELLTLVTAFSAFAVAGNTFPTYADFDPAELHYAAGLGLRFGKSKSTTKGVQHINISWPIGERYLPGPTFSVLARKTL